MPIPGEDITVEPAPDGVTIDATVTGEITTTTELELRADLDTTSDALSKRISFVDVNLVSGSSDSFRNALGGYFFNDRHFAADCTRVYFHKIAAELSLSIY